MADTTFDVTYVPWRLVKPEGKDYERALGLVYLNSGIPQSSKADRMAKLIKDPLKLVRRSKAVVGIWGTEDYLNDNDEVENVWLPFKRALIAMGFTPDQVAGISEFEIDEENL
jgi:hypothetical protein